MRYLVIVTLLAWSIVARAESPSALWCGGPIFSGQAVASPTKYDSSRTATTGLKGGSGFILQLMTPLCFEFEFPFAEAGSVDFGIVAGLHAAIGGDRAGGDIHLTGGLDIHLSEHWSLELHLPGIVLEIEKPYQSQTEVKLGPLLGGISFRYKGFVIGSEAAMLAPLNLANGHPWEWHLVPLMLGWKFALKRETEPKQPASPQYLQLDLVPRAPSTLIDEPADE